MGRLGIDEPLMSQRLFRSPHHTISAPVPVVSTPVSSIFRNGSLILEMLENTEKTGFGAKNEPVAGC
jgi:hypothetical protein